jgi:hypothetical protein
MALDLHKVANSISAMTSELACSKSEQAERLRGALKIFGSPGDIGAFKNKIAASKTSWLVAEIIDGLNNKYLPADSPDEFSVLATDGSQIDVDRHRGARCYLINIGTVKLKYGKNPEALLENHPLLFSREEDMVVRPDICTPGREMLVEGSLLGIKRTIEEFNHLAGLCAELPVGASALALVDGSLIMWGLLSKDYPDYIINSVLDEGVLKHMDSIRQMNPGRRVALASYISFTRSTDVANALRVLVCPHETADCDRHCTGIEAGKRPCAGLDGIHDRDIFWQWLNQGERSEVFASMSRINCTRYGKHRVHFYYLKSGDEIVRVEVPEWVARDRDLLNLSHSLVVSQCGKGQGYPVALSEAHEQAVVTGADRENFYRLVEEYLAGKKLPASVSAKSFSKKTRWV